MIRTRRPATSAGSRTGPREPDERFAAERAACDLRGARGDFVLRALVLRLELPASPAAALRSRRAGARSRASPCAAPLTSSWVAGRRSSSSPIASRTRSRTSRACRLGALTSSSSVSRVRSRVLCAPPTVAWTVRSTASRTASGSSFGVVRRFAMGSAQCSICGPMPETPIHLSPATDLAERVLLPGDPHRALHVAQALLEKPMMFNHHRGLWGYTGHARDGAATHDPVDRHGRAERGDRRGGADRARVRGRSIRIGTCGALVEGIELGTLVPVEAAIAADGASRALGADGRVAGGRRDHPALAEAAGGGHRRPRLDATSSTTRARTLRRAWVADGAAVVEMEAAAVLQVAERRGVRAGCLLAVTDKLAGGRVRAGNEAVEKMGLALGETAWRRSSGRTSSSSARPRRSGAPAPAAGARRPAPRPRGSRRGRARARPGGLEPLGELRVARGRRPSAPADASRSSSRSTPSSIPSRRCETDRSRRVSRSMSAAEGIPSAPIAASCAWTAFSRASKARASAALITGFATSSSATLPRASSPWRERRSFSPSSVRFRHGAGRYPNCRLRTDLELWVEGPLALAVARSASRCKLAVRWTFVSLRRTNG